MKKTSSKMLLTTAFILLFSSQNFVNGLGQVSVSENRIVNVRDPIDKTDVATKNYVDNKIEGIQTPPVVLQTEGKSETAVMSQKAVSSIVSKPFFCVAAGSFLNFSKLSAKFASLFAIVSPPFFNLDLQIALTRQLP